VKSSFLGIPYNELISKGALYTAKEINNQPELWLKVYNVIKENYEGLKIFLNEVYNVNNVENFEIILTGAGTSAFIGNVLEGIFRKYSFRKATAVATTELVTHPDCYFQKNNKTLLISFARSGNSPESTKAVALANKLCGEVFHLIITCNAEGELAKNASNGNSYVLLMPPEADDKSLVMSGSFTSMLFKRAVFLGSGIFKGIAEESALKLQELTDGQVICKHDSFLGFRHGPKAVINEDTLIVYLFSNDEYVMQYEKDLVRAGDNGRKALCSIGVMEIPFDNLKFDLKIIISHSTAKLEEVFLSIVSVLPAQILGFFKSLNLGLKPDTPSESGMITRVVQGVKIYPFE
jgi:tagatose-6-phosphate ketose/aldose isomerase